MSLFSLKGKTALVTGCKRGIGFAIAEALAEAGADILGVSASLETSGSAIEKAVKAAGSSFKGYQCDFSDRKSLYAFIEKVKDKNVSEKELIDFCGETLAGFKVPKRVEFCELPKTSTGKIQKFELRKKAKEQT